MGLLLLISCNNILVSPREGSSAGSGETGIALISFGNGVTGARTLFPASVSFQRYDLTIAPVSPTTGPTSYETILAGSSASIALDPGTWSIHAEAYTDTGGNNKAAEGDSGTFTVIANQTTPVTIDLAAVTGAGSGILSVEISGETNSVINYGYLTIRNGTDFNDLVTFYNGWYDTTYEGFSPSGLDLDISLPAGQYLVAVELYNAAGQGAYITELAYIYSNLTTELVESVGAADFADVTVISGTVQYQENGVNQSGYSLTIYTNPEGTGRSLASIYISTYDTPPYSYTFHVPRPDTSTTLYFVISHNGQQSSAGSLALAANQATASKTISLNRNVITLSGTIGAVTVNGNTPDYVDVHAYVSEGNSYYSYNSPVSGNSWAISGIPADFAGTFAIDVGVSYNGSWFSSGTVATWTSGSSTTGIDLGNITFKTLSGTIGAVTVNGNTPDDVDIYAHASDNNNYYFHNALVSGSNWHILIPADFVGTLAIEVVVRYNDSWSYTDVATWTSGSSATGIDLGNITLKTLSGTIDMVTVDGNPVTGSVRVYAGASVINNQFYSGPVSRGSWQLLIPGDFTGPLALGVEVEHNDTTYSKNNIAAWTSGSPSAGISLGNVSFITLSGTIGTVTVNGTPADYVAVLAHASGGNNYYNYGGSVSGNSWRIGIPADVTGTLIIGVAGVYNDFSYYKDNIATWTSGSPSAGINLENVSISLSPLGGTVTTNGSSPLSEGSLVVLSLSQPPANPAYLSDLLAASTILGNAEITGGSFSGYVESGVTSGYVLIALDNGSGPVYCTPSSAPLGASMSLSIASMLPVVNDLY
jgi:hypothetical protein